MGDTVQAQSRDIFSLLCYAL
ncbi:hypothetical protein XFF6990_310149 [Xanthomonas citri pv. fuscans]|nr:hypothetical protein XFF6990_310149 [Xanthomonas citri pv. fuscans]